MAFYDTLVVPMSWAASQLLASLRVDLKNLVLSYFPSDTFACSVRLCMRLVVPYLGHRVINLAGVGEKGRAPLVFLVGAYLSLSDPIHAILSFMDHFVAFLAVHTLLFCSLAVFDSSLYTGAVLAGPKGAVLSKAL